MRSSHQILLATLNPHKFQEFQSLMAQFPEIELIRADRLLRNAENLGHAEQHSTYLENAIAKARLANKAAHYPSLADDSGLEVEALEGRPGIRSHRYASPQAQLSQDQSNLELLLSEMKSTSNRSARFVCALALIIEGVLIHATGTLEGALLEAPRGTHGFGYDPIFVPKDSTLTLAEMTSNQKNEISHRSKAIEALMKQVKAYGINFVKP